MALQTSGDGRFHGNAFPFEHLGAGLDPRQAQQIEDEGVKPLSLLTIEDLENLLPYLGEVSLPEILDEYIKPHEPLFSFEHILNRFRKQRKILP